MKKKEFRRCLSHVPMKRLLVMLLSFSFFVPLFAQQIDISGTVTEASTGDPLPGVNVFVEGTTSGTITDANGKYSISAQPDAVLVFSYVGFNTEEISVAGQTTIDVQLVSDIETLNEIVVIGYGTQRKEAVTGSVASMRGDEIREVASGDVTHALQGRIPGVTMQQTNSKPGSSMQIRIRGTRSLTADNGPLIVLDGIPFAGEITDIDMSDIKSVDILKDASATAIYGSRGANGVILISTNKGRKGQEAQVSYNSYYGIKNAVKYPMMNTAELAAVRDSVGLYGDGLDESRDVDTDWQDEFYRQATITSHDLKVTGGTEKGSYNFGLGYFLDQAVIPTQQYERFSLRASLDQEIGKYFRFGFSSNNNFSFTQGTQIGIYGILSASPMLDPYNPDGTVKDIVQMPLDPHYVLTKEKLEDIGEEWVGETRAYGTYNNMYGELSIPWVKGLKYRTNVGLNLRLQKYGSFKGVGIDAPSNPDTPSEASTDDRFTTNWVIENLLTYDRTFADKHQVNIVALYSAEENTYTRQRVTAKDIPNPDFQYYNMGLALGEISVAPGDQEYQLSSLVSWMGRAMYSYDSKYMITAAVRSDGSSRLAEGHKWHTYPAISAGWNIGREAFMESITAINMLKIRVGYGETSNQAVDPYSTLGLLASRPYNFGPTGYAMGYFVSQLTNEALGWEYSETYNYGLDFALLANRLSGTFEYYTTYTKDILLSLSLPRTSGVDGGYTANIGETKNTGFEVSLNGTIIEDLNGVSWDAGINLYSNKNELIALASGQEEDEGNWWFVGHPINVIYDYEYDGLWQEGDPYIEDLESGSPESNLGMIKVKYHGDYEEDGTPSRRIGPDDRVPIHVDPKFLGGFNTRVTYKGFDLTAVGAFQNGGILISTMYGSNGYLNMLSGRRNNVKVDYWTPTNTDARYPRPASTKSGDNPKYGSTLAYFDASYLKIRALTLGYNFTSMAWAKNAGISQLRVYVTAQNPFVMFSPYHKETGLDPETNSYGNENAAVNSTYKRRLLTVSANTPQTKNYLIGINVTF